MEAELANRAKKKGKTEEAEKWSKMDGKNKPTSQQANRPPRPTRRQRKQLNIIAERKPSTKASIRKGSA